MSSTGFGITNLVTGATLAAGSAIGALPITNLQTDLGSPSTAWQTANGVRTAAAGAWFTVTPPAGAQTWRAFVLTRTNLRSAATVTFELFNNPSTLVYSATVAGPVAGYGQVPHVAPADQVADYLKVSINDNGNADNHINVPLGFAGPLWLTASPMSWSSTVGRDSQIDEVVSGGGQEYPYLRWDRRRWNIVLDGVRVSELWSKLGELDRLSRMGGNYLAIPDIASVNLYQEAIFGRVRSPADISFPYQGADRRHWSASVTERI